MSFPSGLSLSLCVGLGFLLAMPASLTLPEKTPQAATTSASAKAKNSAPEPPARVAAPQIDLRKAVALALPEPPGTLQAATFQTPDGKSGWVLRISGARPIATPAYADGMLYLLGEEDGTVVLIDASPDGWQEHGRFTLSPLSEIRKSKGHIWTHPVIVDGKLFLRDQDHFYCYDVKGAA